MAKYGVTKTPFPQKFLDGFLWNFGGRRQIDAEEGTESFASISGAVFELPRKSAGEGGQNLFTPPPAAVRVLSFVILCLNAFFASNATFGINEPFFKLVLYVRCPAVEMVLTKVRSIFPSTGRIFKIVDWKYNQQKCIGVSFILISECT